MMPSFIIPTTIRCAECGQPGESTARNAKIPSGVQHNACRRARDDRQRTRMSRRAIAERRRCA